MKNFMKNNKFMFQTIGVFVLVFSFVFVPSLVSADFNQIVGNTTMQVGSRGNNVKALQAFLSSNNDIYPSGSQDGVFGPATKNAVVQFQLAYNLTPDGIIGGGTRNIINNLISSGVNIDIYAPAINNLSVVPVGRNVNITFNSNEPVMSVVYYDTNNLTWRDWDQREMSLKVPEITGLKNTDLAFTTNKQFTLNNLSPNTVYHYTVLAKDRSGNVTLIWPTVLTTGQ